MANIKSAIKRAKTAAARARRNKSVKSTVRTAIKKLEAAVKAGSPEVDRFLGEASKMIDKAASKGVIHKNAASRKKSRLARKVNAARASQ
ncbi:MAG: 30S ribosomal protein S20 [Firmicutes bacterium]|nr:30S ribosomal protein S20 [Bacillota bacterium]